MKRKPSRQVNFTKRTIEALKAKDRRVIVYDSQVRGLGVVCQPGSGSKSFFWFRRIGGTPTWRTIGSTHDLSIEQARRFAQDWNSKLATWKASDYAGPGPLEERRDVTLGELLADYCAKHLQANAKNPAKAIEYAHWQVDTYIPKWRNRKLYSIRREHVRELHAKLGKSSGEITANRVVQLIRTLYNFAAREELFRGDNPGEKITMNRERSRDRFLQPGEFPKLFQALRDEPSKDLRDFVLLALFTGARRSNLMGMRWEQLDLLSATWTIPEPKNETPYTVALVPEAVAILKKRGPQK